MGSVGAPEILVILVLALLVLGPDRLPQAARTMGRWVGEIRKLTGSLQAEVQDVVDEVMRPVNETATVATESFTSTFSTGDSTSDSTGESTGDAGSSALPVEPGEPGTEASPSVATSDPLPSEEATLAADVPLPTADAASPAFPAPPVDPSLN